MITGFHNPAILKYHYSIGINNGTESVSSNYDTATLKMFQNSLHYLCLSNCISEEVASSKISISGSLYIARAINIL